MKLAEALAARADLQRRIEQLRSRISANARFQEGEEPAEDAAALLAEAHADLDRLGDLISRINATNALLDLGGGRTMTDALAARDVLKLRHALVTDAAAAASGSGGAFGHLRQMRSELRQFAALPVAELRGQADAIARELRELDGRIQQANWTNDLKE